MKNHFKYRKKNEKKIKDKMTSYDVIASIWVLPL